MRKVLMRSLTVLVILALSIGAGFAYDYFCDVFDRKAHPREYSEYVNRYAVEYGVPEHIIYAVVKTESNFRSDARSPSGALGLMQLTPDTFDWLMLHLKGNYEVGMLYDPETNIKYGTYFLSYLYREFGLWDTAWAAYNAGVARVKEWQKNGDYADENGVLTAIPYKETREYVEKVKKTSQIYERLYY